MPAPTDQEIPGSAAWIIQLSIRRLEVALRDLEHGGLDERELELLLRNVKHRLSRSCFCPDQACCPVHHTHVQPHRFCLLPA